MPRYCNIKDCKKVSKWKSEGTIPTIHLCDTHSKAMEEITFIKIVNSPCRTCVAEKKQDIREASYGPIIKGKKKRWYCKQHVPIDRMMQKKANNPRTCIFPDCYITANFKNPVTKKIEYCKTHVPV